MRCKLLLIEDNPGDARLLHELLETAQPGAFELAHAGTLAEGLARLGSPGFSVVLLDLGLPDAEGLESLRRVRAAAPSMPIVVLTGRDDDELASRALREGAEDYLVKGQGDGALIARAIRYSIERKRNEEELRRAHDELEVRVQERTADLARTNTLLQEEIAVRTKAEERLRETLHEKEILVKEIHHRVKNNLQVVASMLSLQIANVSDEASRVPLIESQGRVHAIALIHEKLYGSHDLARVPFKAYLEELVCFFGHSYSAAAGRVRLDLDVEDVELDVATAIPVALVSTELLTNALKHAFPEQARGRVLLSLQRADDNRYRLAVADDGVGLPENVDPGSSGSLGFEIISVLTHQLGGTLEVRRGGGTRFELLFALQR